MKNQSITSLPRSPEEDRRARMIKYSLAMGIRMICILSLLFVQGWWLVIMGIGAIVLPYIAVVLANVGARPGGAVEAPTGREITLRNPQAPIIVPPAEEQQEQQPSPRPGSFPESGGARPAQASPQASPQAGEWRFPDAGDARPAEPSSQASPQAGEWRFPESFPEGTFPRESSPRESSSAPQAERPFPTSTARPFPQPAERPADRSTEGQA